MYEYLNILNQIITLDIFIGYGVYSILFVILSLIRKSESLNQLDKSANRIISFTGIIYFLALTPFLINALVESEKRLYWWMPWMQCFLWVFISQLMWIKRLRTSKIVRIIISLLFIFSFERYVIIVSSFHRDYSASYWLNDNLIFNIATGLLFKMAFFLALAIIYDNVAKALKKKQVKNVPD